MSDDSWRRTGGDADFDNGEFGGPLFPDDAAGGRSDDTGERRLRFGPDDSGSLPHWSDPPTGEVPRLVPRATESEADDSEDVDVWSTFTTESPVWRDDDENTVTSVIDQVQPGMPPPSGPASGSVPRQSASGSVDRPQIFDRGRDFDPTGGFDRDPSGGIDTSRSLFGDDEPSGSYGRTTRDPSGAYPITSRDPSGSVSRTGRDPSGAVPRTRSAERGSMTGEVPRQAGRITIGTDPSGMTRRNPDPRRRPSGAPRPGQRPVRSGSGSRNAPSSPRNMTNAIIAGAVLAVAFVVALIVSPLITLAIVAIVLALGGWEYFGKVAEKGYRPALLPGLLACLLTPVAAYAFGINALPLVLVLVFVVSAISFIGASGVEAGPLPNMAVTTLGVVWVAMLGGFAGLILRFSTGVTSLADFSGGPIPNLGTDTLFMIALGVAVNDIGALAVGSLVGKTPLRAWVSPSKTLEGLLGGTLATFIVLFVASKLVPDGNFWGDSKNILLLALVICVLAPLGDLTESMFKRNLEIKDFGTIIQGHGGVLDRFDGFLFVLPGVYYLTLVLNS